jgi:hypothetical protein
MWYAPEGPREFRRPRSLARPGRGGEKEISVASLRSCLEGESRTMSCPYGVPPRVAPGPATSPSTRRPALPGGHVAHTRPGPGCDRLDSLDRKTQGVDYPDQPAGPRQAWPGPTTQRIFCARGQPNFHYSQMPQNIANCPSGIACFILPILSCRMSNCSEWYMRCLRKYMIFNIGTSKST